MGHSTAFCLGFRGSQVDCEFLGRFCFLEETVFVMIVERDMMQHQNGKDLGFQDTERRGLKR